MGAHARAAGPEQDRVQPPAEGARGVAGQPARRLQAQGHRQPPEVPISPTAALPSYSPSSHQSPAIPAVVRGGSVLGYCFLLRESRLVPLKLRKCGARPRPDLTRDTTRCVRFGRLDVWFLYYFLRLLLRGVFSRVFSVFVVLGERKT